jgi:hypothetical protein
MGSGRALGPFDAERSVAGMGSSRCHNFGLLFVVVILVEDFAVRMFSFMTAK